MKIEFKDGKAENSDMRLRQQAFEGELYRFLFQHLPFWTSAGEHKQRAREIARKIAEEEFSTAETVGVGAASAEERVQWGTPGGVITHPDTELHLTSRSMAVTCLSDCRNRVDVLRLRAAKLKERA